MEQTEPSREDQVKEVAKALVNRDMVMDYPPGTNPNCGIISVAREIGTDFVLEIGLLKDGTVRVAAFPSIDALVHDVRSFIRQVEKKMEL